MSTPDKKRFQYHIEVNLDDRFPEDPERVHKWLELAESLDSERFADCMGHDKKGTSSAHFFSGERLTPKTVRSKLTELDLKLVAFIRLDCLTGQYFNRFPMRSKSRLLTAPR